MHTHHRHLDVHHRSNAAAIAPPSVSPGRGAQAPKRQTGAPSLSRASRCDSSSSIASLLFEFEGDEDASAMKEAAPRLPSDLQKLVACSQDARLWVDALEARKHACCSKEPMLMTSSGTNKTDTVVGPAGGSTSASGSQPLPQHLLQHRTSAPLPAGRNNAFNDAASPEMSFLCSSSSAGLPALSLSSMGSSPLPGSLGMGAGPPAVDVRKFAQSLAGCGHCVWVRSGCYTCPPESGMGTIRHKFVVVSVPGEGTAGQSTYMVVDPNYLSHFQLAAKGPEADHYRSLLALLPSVFVGTADQLAGMANRLCKEMEKVFLARGVPLPPWRSPRVMQGRWLVSQVLEDELVPSTPPSMPHQQVLQGGHTLSGELHERLPALVA